MPIPFVLSIVLHTIRMVAQKNLQSYQILCLHTESLLTSILQLSNTEVCKIIKGKKIDQDQNLRTYV